MLVVAVCTAVYQTNFQTITVYAHLLLQQWSAANPTSTIQVIEILPTIVNAMGREMIASPSRKSANDFKLT
jgi:uncharacterized membrane protein